MILIRSLKKKKSIYQDKNNNLKEIAKNYKTRGEFQRLDGSAYSTARRAGYLDSICVHMVVGSYSIPQLTLLYILKKLFVGSNIEYNCKTIVKLL